VIYTQVKIHRGREEKLVLLPGYAYHQGDVVTLVGGLTWIVDSIFGEHEVIPSIVAKEHSIWREDR